MRNASMFSLMSIFPGLMLDSGGRLRGGSRKAFNASKMRGQRKRRNRLQREARRVNQRRARGLAV